MNIAVLTSGGDAPGMNAAIRAVVRSSIYEGWNVFGVQSGYMGLIAQEIIQLGVYSVADIIHRGGTVLHTARCEEMKTSEGLAKAAEALERFRIDALVVIGGDGSYAGALALNSLGVRVVTLPGTIDNDLACTDRTIGFDTALNTAVDAIGKIRDTSAANNRVDVIEVMGRNCGDIALYSGLAGGAEAIAVPEMPVRVNEICEKMIRGKNRGKLHSIIVYAEGCGDCDGFCSEVESISGMVVRKTKLGYIQRGGTPSAFDRMIASWMGDRAVRAIGEGAKCDAVCYRDNRIVMEDLARALEMKKVFDRESYDVLMRLSI